VTPDDAATRAYPDPFSTDFALEDPDESETPPSEMSTMVDTIRELIKVRSRRKAVDAEGKELDRLDDKLSAAILEEMVTLGVTTPPAVDGMTVFVRRTTYLEHIPDPETGRKRTTAEIVDVLRATGLGALVSEGYSGGTLKAHLAELGRGKLPVPDALGAIVTLGTTRAVGVTRASVAKREAAAPID
jgi:hypothetical protein